MPSGLGSPRGRSPVMPDLGERSAFVSGQRVGRVPRRHRRGAGRVLRVLALGVLALGVVLALGLGVRWLLENPRFAVGRIEVRGAARVSRAQILEAAAIAPGTSIFRVDTDAVVRRLLAIPGLRRAEVVREIPNRVVIAVEERRPFTLVHAGRLHWLDEEGRLLGPTAEAVAPSVPIVSGLSEEELASMRMAPGPKARVAIDLIRALLRSGSALTAEISEIDVSRREGPVLYTLDGVEVRLGAEDWEERLGRLEGVLAHVPLDDVRAVDLRFRDQVVLKRGGSR